MPAAIGDALVREYNSRADFERELPYLTQQGYSVGTVTEIKQSAGILRILTLGLISLIAPPKAHLLVTYRKA